MVLHLPAADQILLLSLRHEGTPACHGVDVALHLQLGIGPLDGVGVDGQIHGKAPNRRQLFPRCQHAGDHQPPQAVLHLLINGTGVPIIQTDQ